MSEIDYSQPFINRFDPLPVGVSDPGLSEILAREDHSHAMGRLQDAQYERNTALNIPNNTLTTIPFNGREPAGFDNLRLNTGVSPWSIFTVPTGLGGWYQVFGFTILNVTPGAVRAFNEIQAVIGGVNIFARVPFGTGESDGSCCGLFRLAPGDTLRMNEYQVSGGAIQLDYALFSVVRLCP